MQTNLTVPQKINVGFQERSDTYSKKLAYIIYYDHKGVLRKEASWQSWRDKRIPNQEFENIPTEGFVLNKKAGGYSTGWNHRQTYCRVYDPRGFEFEIEISNLLYILEINDSIKGKGLTGEYVYAWEGKDLILLPVEAPEYKEISEFNKILIDKSYLKSKDLKVGFDYRTKQNETLTYLGRFDYYEDNGRYGGHLSDDKYGKKKGKRYYFSSGLDGYFQHISSLGDRILEEVSDSPNEDYAAMLEKLEYKDYYSPWDESKTEYKRFTALEIGEKLGQEILHYHRLNTAFYTKEQNSDFYKIFRIFPHRILKEGAKANYWGQYSSSDYENVKGIYQVYPLIKKEVRPSYYSFIQSSEYTLEFSEEPVFTGSLGEIMNKYIPLYKNEYLSNGKIHRSKVVDIPRA